MCVIFFSCHKINFTDTEDDVTFVSYVVVTEGLCLLSRMAVKHLSPADGAIVNEIITYLVGLVVYFLSVKSKTIDVAVQGLWKQPSTHPLA